MMKKRAFTICLAACIAIAVIAGTPTATIAAYPEKPITLLIPYGPGGSADLAARVLAAAIEKILGRPVVPTNKGGGGGAIALGELYAAAPDGYTIALATGSNTTIMPFATKVAYDTLKFSYIATLFDFSYLLAAHPSIPAKDLDEFVAWAKANPNALINATAGAGFNIQNLAIELISQKYGGFEYRSLQTNSAAEGTARFLAGDANVYVGDTTLWVPQIKSGAARGIGVLTHVTTPELEALKLPSLTAKLGFAIYNTAVVIAPPALPEDIRARLEAAVKTAIETPALREQMQKLNLPIAFRPGPEAAELTAKTYEMYGNVIKKMMAKK